MTAVAPPRPDLEPVPKRTADQVALAIVLVLPLLAVLVAALLGWGWALGWRDIVIATVMYVVSGLGITVGFHRYFTHGAFTARRGVRIALAIAGSLALQMSPIDWTAAHRQHHRFSDRDGDPHSPWRYGTGWRALLKGAAYAHVGWLFEPTRTSPARYCPDLVADPDIRRISARFNTLVLVSFLLPPLVGGLWSWSVGGALTAFFWGSLVRIFLLHHVTFSINSICHIVGRSPFTVRDHSRNVWWLAIPSFGESWHNLHHAAPTCARHGVLRGQLDSSARVIWTMEKLGWVSDVKWPDAARLAGKRCDEEKEPVAG